MTTYVVHRCEAQQRFMLNSWACLRIPKNLSLARDKSIDCTLLTNKSQTDVHTNISAFDRFMMGQSIDLARISPADTMPTTRSVDASFVAATGMMCQVSTVEREASHMSAAFAEQLWGGRASSNAHHDGWSVHCWKVASRLKGACQVNFTDQEHTRGKISPYNAIQWDIFEADCVLLRKCRRCAKLTTNSYQWSTRVSCK